MEFRRIGIGEDELPCIYKNCCGFDICNLSDCPYYEPKTEGKKFWEEEEHEDY